MRLRILGCSGGIGGANHTTAFLLNESVLIDAGTGLQALSLQEMLDIDHVFLTHAHFDHIACLPMLIDSVIGLRRYRPLYLHASTETLAILREHVFNWRIWPDFSLLPDESIAFLRYCPHEVGETREAAACRITALPARHTVPAVGFCLDSGNSSLVYSGDTVGCADFWDAVNAIGGLSTLIIETAFPDSEQGLAHASKHLCPATLQRELAHLERSAQILITHLKPADSDLIMQEIAAAGLPVRRLLAGETIEF
ncbi:Ribonuclease BN, tRNA processing enzyme [Formivibrio citricus]|uniref:Ribonuclease BN, tRNA processing enzyme n=1 Tax=Formivibrio citricus TaxID=83765 RepID=A0A1I4XT45_9NEIS|nr:3',5'-cyclic-nucleotide phosphodiesterase [Formivibrio citricus]SFN29035.1 Ribonuclease BN, tRNA processing enzyme [Formivibrio citricus]